MKPKTKDEIQPARWSEGNQVLFLGGKAFGVSPHLKTICIGDEKDILTALEDKKSTGNDIIDNILTLEMNNRADVNLPVKHKYWRRPKRKR